MALRHSVIESVKKSGQENLAKYLLDVYHHLEENSEHERKHHGRKRKLSVYELNVFDKHSDSDEEK